MKDLLLSLVVFTVLAAGGLALLAATTVAPFAAALQLASTRALSSAVVGAAAAVGVVLGLSFAALAAALGAFVMVPVALALGWVVPAGLRLLGRPSLAGRAGAHE